MCAPLSNQLVESALCCRICRYNLTGLTEQRCPECGTGFVSSPAASAYVLAGEHVLIFINVTAILLGLVLSLSSPPEQTTADAALLWAMLMPLQCVLGLAGIVVGVYLLCRAANARTVVLGMVGPLLFAGLSLFLALRAFFA